MINPGISSSPSIEAQRHALAEEIVGRQYDAHPESLGQESRDNLLPNHRIIVVDDEPENRALCRHILEPVGIVCDEAIDGLQGLKSTTWGNYDLVLLDIDMPKMQGTEVLRRLRVNERYRHPSSKSARLTLSYERARHKRLLKRRLWKEAFLQRSHLIGWQYLFR